MRRFFAFFSANSFSRVYPEPNAKKEKDPPTSDSLEMQILELQESAKVRVEEYVKSSESALSLAIQRGVLKDTDTIVVETRKHLEEVKQMQ